jgi:hypothetical protein
VVQHPEKYFELQMPNRERKQPDEDSLYHHDLNKLKDFDKESFFDQPQIIQIDTR